MRVLLQKVAATATTATAFPVIWRGCEQHCATRQESGGKRINDFGSLSSRSLGAQRIGRKRNKDFYTTLCINGHTHHHHRLIPSTMLPMMEETDPFARRWAATSVSCQLDPPDLATSIWIAILLCASEKRIYFFFFFFFLAWNLFQCERDTTRKKKIWDVASHLWVWAQVPFPYIHLIFLSSAWIIY